MCFDSIHGIVEDLNVVFRLQNIFFNKGPTRRSVDTRAIIVINQ